MEGFEQLWFLPRKSLFGKYQKIYDNTYIYEHNFLPWTFGLSRQDRENEESLEIVIFSAWEMSFTCLETIL